MKPAILTVCTLFCLNLAAFAMPQAMVKPATDGRGAAKQWLALLDAGSYGSCWGLASRTFQSSVSKAQWVTGMNSARRFYGKVLSRKFKDATYTANPPGFAPGEYEILQYRVPLGAQGSATEVVLMVMEGPGVWRLAGYTIVLKDKVWVHPLEFLDHG